MEDELVVINLESGCYYSLDPMATLLWTQLQKGCTADQMFKKFSADSPEKTLEEINTFITFLIDEELIAETTESADLALCDLESYDLAFKTPCVQKFTDMQEMLLLDPIHEVSDKGWPHEPK